MADKTLNNWEKHIYGTRRLYANKITQEKFKFYQKMHASCPAPQHSKFLTQDS